MWKYRSSDELYHSSDELYHYGILGMKWRQHKYKKLKSEFDQYKANQNNYKQGYEDSKNQFKNKDKLKQATKTRNRELAKGLGKTALGYIAGGLIGKSIDRALKKKGKETYDLGKTLGSGIGGLIGVETASKNLKKSANAFNYTKGYNEKNTKRYKQLVSNFDDINTDMSRQLSAYNDIANINKKKKKK